ncbi:MAG: peptidase U32 family protein [Spirochaetales bacterium]
MNLELLSPAGNPEKLRVALEYGADAVYAGAPSFSLRKASENFTPDEFAEALAYAHQRGKKVYLAANIFFHNEDLQPFENYLREAVPLGFDGIILSDLGAIDHVREHYPELDVHVSTQANTTNKATARLYQKLGVKRIVLARELTLPEIREIRDAVDLELEAFVHGSMCIAYSGRCLLSNYFSHQAGGPLRDANRGECTQVCRWEYALTEKTRPGEYLPVEQDDYGTAVMSSRDLNLAPHLGDLLAAGVTSFKIEGRMKSSWYAAVTARVYRHALDRAARGLSPDPVVLAELNAFSHREYSTGFYYQPGRGPQTTEALAADANRVSRQERLLIAVVEEVRDNGLGGSVVVAKAMNPVRVGTTLTTMTPGGADGELRDFTLSVGGEARELVRPTERFELEAESGASGLKPSSFLLQ